MLDPPDYPALIAGHTRVMELVNTGEIGLPVLDDLLRVAQDALGAAGMSFAEHGPHGGRIVAATGAARWALGRPANRGAATLPDVLAGPPVQDVPAESLCPDLADQLHGRGLGELTIARAEVGGTLVGTLYAHYAQRVPGEPEHHAVMAYLAASVARLYGNRAGLPIRTEPPDGSPQRRRDQDNDLFLAVTSHELRTPVTVIKGYAETLHHHWDSLSEADRRQAAGVIGQRAADLARLVDRLFSTANEISLAGESAMAPFDLAEALRSAVADLPDDLRQRIVVELPDELPKAVGDRASVATVLIELVNNAGKYSPSGTPVELSATADERTVIFRVSDRGIGVRPEHVERAFDRFWQAESGDRRRFPGAGLGLYLVRRLVERQNGWVSLRPREIRGTVAEVRLPRG